MAADSFAGLKSFTLLAILILTAGCRSSQMAVETTPPATPAAAGEVDQAVFEGAPIEEAELPPDFPSDFPIPPGTRIASTLDAGGPGEFRVFLSLEMLSAEAVAWYQAELQAQGWEFEVPASAPGGTALKISSETYAGDLLFVDAEEGTGLDVHIMPAGSALPLPEIPESLGESADLGSSESTFPTDLPIPANYTPVGLPDQAQAEGYELAFLSDRMAEMAMVDLNLAFMTAGWEIGEPTVDAASGVYLIPFSNPASGFQGYAAILRDGNSYGLGAGSTLILLAPGVP